MTAEEDGLASKEATRNQERIVAATLELLRDQGFDGFNMRGLADALGLTPGAAYRHFGGKDKILSMAADRILQSIPMVDGVADWREAFAANARAYREAFRRYPGLPAYLTRHLAETSTRKLAIEESVAILMRAGLSHGDAMRTAGVLNAYLRASVGSSGQPGQARGRPSTRDDGDARLDLDDATFEFGLQLLIGGIERQAGKHLAGRSRS